MSKKKNRVGGIDSEQALEMVLDELETAATAEDLARELAGYGVLVSKELRAALNAPAPTRPGVAGLLEDYKRLQEIESALREYWSSYGPYGSPEGLNPYGDNYRAAHAAGEMGRYSMWGRINDYYHFDDSE